LKKRILFRCDGGNIPEIGMGHVTRCLVLAEILRKNPDVNIAFLMRNLQGATQQVTKQGFKVFTFDSNENESLATLKVIVEYSPDIVVIDRLATDPNYMSLIKRTGVILISFDDLGEGRKYADITINPILTTGKGLYEGYDYMVFPFKNNNQKICKQKCTDIFVSFGGYDHFNLTKEFISILVKKNLPFNFHVVVSNLYDNYRGLKKLCRDNDKIKLCQNPSNFADLLFNADMAVVSGGLTMFQAVAGGVPAIVIPQYEHQLQSAKNLHNFGAVVGLEMGCEVSFNKVIEQIYRLASDFNLRNNIASIGRNLIDGLGNNRVTELIGIIDKLKWDTKFFNTNIAYLYPKRIRENIVHFALKKCKEDDIDCLYYLCNCHDPESVRLAEKYGFHFVDIRLTFNLEPVNSINEKISSTISKKNKLIIRPSKREDEPVLEKIAQESYIHSRYFFDRHFPVGIYKKFYADWIEKSARGKFDDIVLVAEVKEKIAGYISCKVQTHNLGSIGLVGVSRNFVGKKVGTHLVNAAIKWLFEKGVSKIKVVTQGRNIPAQRLYQSCGFKTAITELWYHKWFKKEYHI